MSCEDEADIPARLKVKTGTVKKNASVPSFIPQPFTIRHAFRTCLEIRAVPKKPLLRALVDFTGEENDKRRIEELCSRQGSNAYSELIRMANVTLLDILAIFPSCKPTFQLLAQHLPRLQPRRYSIANSPLVDSSHLSFVFNVVRLNAENGLVFQRNGVCTGNLETYASHISTDDSTPQPDNLPVVDIFRAKSTGFELPNDSSLPIVMIGPGTGVAPFVGFLEHRAALGNNLGEAWLFYGCRHKDRDFLYQEKLENFVTDGLLTRLIVAFSRDQMSAKSCRYVQDNLRLYKSDVVNLLLKKNATFYVCGDARNMAKNVRQCIIEIIASEMECDQASALEQFEKVVAEKRYKEDIWT